MYLANPFTLMNFVKSYLKYDQAISMRADDFIRLRLLNNLIMDKILEILSQPWPWYIGGPLIGLTVPVLLIFGNKVFGISSSLRHICAVCIPANIPFFKYDWKRESWNLIFVSGVLLGGIIACTLLKSPGVMIVHENLQAELQSYGITNYNALMPEELFNFSSLLTLKGFTLMIVGGFLVGFGSRYAGGCTSGHAISGISNLQIASVIATLCFMVGGMIMANFILPFILNL